MKTFIPWMGGKQAIASEILSFFPEQYEKYVEVFGGGASVLFAKKPSENFEVYNDFNGNLVNLFQVIRDKPIAFLDSLHIFPLNSRQEFYELQQLIKGKICLDDYIINELDIAKSVLTEEDYFEIKELLETRANNRDVQRAVQYYKLIRYSYGNQGRSFSCKPINLASTLYTIINCSERLKNVIIENKDFKEIIPLYDREKTFFYLDPPYYNAEMKYEVKFDEHEALKQVLSDISGRFLLSYNDCKEVRSLYNEYSMIEIKRNNTLLFRYEDRPIYDELLIANYDLQQLKERIEQTTLF